MSDGSMFEGIRVVELGTWVMVPAAAAVLADFGADVVKVEHPVSGDPGRWLITCGVSPTVGRTNVFTEQHHRGKRSVGIDVSKPEGRALLYKLVETCDVFLTNLLPEARTKLGVNVEHIRAIRPDIVYVRGDAVGPRGPQSGKPGYDFSVFWGRSGFLSAVSGVDADAPVSPRPGFGDRTSAMNLAFGVAAALLRRERTGQTAVVDVSLLGSGIWSNASDITYSAGLGRNFTLAERPNTNPLSGSYRTADGRWIILTMLAPDRFWSDFCKHLGREDLRDDPRFADGASRGKNADACRDELAATFATKPLAEWRDRLLTLKAPIELVQDQMDVLSDAQVIENRYITEVEHDEGATVRIAAAPVQFDGERPVLRRAPEVGEHTEEVLLELGYDWDDIIRYKDLGAIN